MFNSNDQTILNGSNNVQAQGNIYYNNYFQNQEQIHIGVYEKDIFSIIEKLEENIDIFDELDEIEDSDFEFDHVEKDKKNELNNLSPAYFDMVCDSYLPLFHKIDEFLKAPQNRESLKKYRKFTYYLKHSITANRQKFGTFEEVLDDIVHTLGDRMVKNNIEIDEVNVVIFLNYMYWNCDIGRRR